jgi:hypothetical protein
MQNSRLMSLIRRVDMFLGTDSETTEIKTAISTETTEINLRYDESRSAGPEQIFDNKGTRTLIGMNGELKLFSNIAQVTLVLSQGTDNILGITSSNGHRFTFWSEVCTEGPMPKSHLEEHKDGFFTYDGHVLTYQDDPADISGKYEYKPEYTPPCPKVNRNPDATYQGNPTP